MALSVYFSPKSMTRAQFDTVWDRLRAAGASDPRGRTFHVCFGSGDQLKVHDIWESQADLDAFGATLMPILADIGVDVGQPFVEEVQFIHFPPK